MFPYLTFAQPKKSARFNIVRCRAPPLAGRMLHPCSMKYIAVLLLAGGTYLAFAQHAAVAPAVVAIAPAPGSDFLKRPLDRTQEVLRQARTRADDPALK